jgi:preprotein translocase subunit SecF
MIGTYSSIAIAAPMLVAYQDWRARRAGQIAAEKMTPAARGNANQKAKVKVKA